MLNSRNIDDLHPMVSAMARDALSKCKDAGIDILVTSTVRDMEAQEALYAQGRTKPGQIVTNAKPGYSAHNFRVALDVVPLRFGKPVWGTSLTEDKELWAKVGAIFESCGFEWAAHWKSFPEWAHFQFTNGLTLADLRAGRTF